MSEKHFFQGPSLEKYARIVGKRVAKNSARLIGLVASFGSQAVG